MTTTARMPTTARNGGFRTVVLLLATMTSGLLAGWFTDWSNTIMPGLGEADDRTFVEAFRELDAAITNPLFLGVVFMGSLLLTGLSVALHLRAGQRPVLVWAGAALVCCLVVCAITFGVHEPLNEKVRSATVPSGAAELAAVRAQLDESMWAAWNTVRAVAATLAFGCLAWALAIHRGPARPAVRSDRGE